MIPATRTQLARLNALRRAGGYVEIHPADWSGVSASRASGLIRQWKTIKPAGSR